MTPTTDLASLAHAAVRPILMVGWFGFGLSFLFRPRGARSSGTAHRDALGWIGFWIQGAGFFFVWGWQRPEAVPLVAWLPWPLVALLVLWLVLIGAGLMWAAVRTLGKQWALAARTLDDHQLITSGPYARIRHPIYTALLAMLLATGLAVGRPLALAVGLAVYLSGTWLRIRAEERVLRATFGAAYDDYANRVPALLPRW